jgi:hypothetical protein
VGGLPVENIETSPKGGPLYVFTGTPNADMMCLLSIAFVKNLTNISPKSVNDENKGRDSDINRKTVRDD